MPLFDPRDLAVWCGGEWTGAPAAPIRRVWHDSRTARPGDLYIALRGERFDGHAFVAAAEAAGAVAALVAARRDRSVTSRVARLVVADPGEALARLARGHRLRSSARLAGVTGSVGKTTVKTLAAAALTALGPTASTAGNWNNAIGLPLSLLGLEPGDRYGVFEVGMNHPGELAPLCALLEPCWALLTRIGPVHLEHFPSEQAIAEEKASLLAALPADGMAILACDEPWFELLRGRAPCRVVTVSSVGIPAEYAAAAVPGGVLVRERGGGEAVYPASLPGVPGRAAVVRAVALARELGADPGVLARALARAALEPMRWERTTVGGVVWVNDAYNANPVSLAAALEMFAGIEAAGRSWLVLGGMGELGAAGPSAHREIGRRMASGPWAGLVVCGAPALDFARGAREAGLEEARLIEAADTAEAARVLDRVLRPGDAVLLKGSRSERMEDVLAAWRKARGATGKGTGGDAL